MRAALFLCAVAACKPDPTPARVDKPIANSVSSTARRAKLPEMTRTNALVVQVQLRAEMAWNDAEAQNTLEAWDLAADLFANVRDACLHECRELAYAAVLARKNALALDPMIAAHVPLEQRPTTPEPMPPRVEAMIEAADAFVASAPAGDEEAAGVGFLAAQQYNTYGWLDESTTRFAQVVTTNPTADVAEYSANLLLDAYNRAERYEELFAYARQLSLNAPFLAAHPEVAELVRDLLARAARAN